MEDETQRKFYLGGLSTSTTEESLNTYFGQWGTITDCIVMREPSTKSTRRYGFVTFSTNEEAEACLNSGPHTVDSTEIDVQRAMPKGGKGRAEAGKKLFVGGLNPETQDEGLKAFFDQFGEVTDCIVMKHKDTGKSRCFGFVTYATTDMVDAVQQNRPHTIDGSKVETKRATTREDSSRGGDSGKSVKKIFVGGFKSKLEDSDLQEYFGSFGAITSAKQILEKGTGKKLGFGFIEFEDYDPVDKIIIQGQHEINGTKVDVRKALGKDEMQGGGGRGGFGGKQGGWGGQQNFGGGNFGGNGYGGGWGGQGGYGGGSWDQSQYGSGWGGQGAAAGGGWSDPSGGWGAGGGYMGDGGWGGGYGASGGMGGGGGAMRNSMGGRGNRSTPYSGGRGGGRGGRGAAGAGRW